MSFEITLETVLIRRVPLNPNFIDVNGQVTSACFKIKKGEDGLSINIKDLVDDVNVLYNNRTHTLRCFKASIPIDSGCSCIHNPQVNNYSHGLVLGDINKIARKLATECTVVY